MGCSGFTGSLTIPEGVTGIGYYAFYGCSGFTEIINYATTPQTIDNREFEGVDKSECILRVPNCRIDAYSAANVWGEFEKIEAIEDYDCFVSGVTLNTASIEIVVGASETLIATVEPPAAYHKNVIWSTADRDIATVVNGVVTGVSAGTVTITVTTEEGGFTAECELTVNVPVDAATPFIDDHPQGAIYAHNAAATALTVTAFVNDGGVLTYQWFSNTVDSNTDGAAISGAIGTGYTPSTATTGTTYYYVIVTNTNDVAIGTKTASATSNTAAVKINPWEIGYPDAAKIIATLDNGTLIISGEGEMQSWSIPDNRPWHGVKDEITSVVINGGVTTIGNMALMDCFHLGSVDLPNSVTKIGDGAFISCCRLLTVDIPVSVTSIGVYAFAWRCFGSGLTEVTIHWETPLSIDGSVFAGENLSDVNLNVPAGAPCAYALAPVWKDFNVIGASFSITASTGNGGVISPAGTTNVTCGSSATYKFEPNSGYEINEVLVDGAVRSTAKADGYYTFSNVTGNHTISVTWKTAALTGIEDMEAGKTGIYPNPARDEIFIKSEAQIKRVEICDISGRIVKTLYATSLQNGVQRISVSDLPQGVYLLRIYTENGMETGKLVVSG